MSTHTDFDPAYEIDSDIPPSELWENDRDSVFYFDTVVKRVIDTTLDGARGRVLDVGSGDGHQLLALLRATSPPGPLSDFAERGVYFGEDAKLEGFLRPFGIQIRIGQPVRGVATARTRSLPPVRRPG